MTFEQTLILEFISILKWLVVGGAFMLMVGRGLKNIISYLLAEMGEKER